MRDELEIIEEVFPLTEEEVQLRVDLMTDLPEDEIEEEEELYCGCYDLLCPCSVKAYHPV